MEMNEDSVRDYVDMQRLMFTLYVHYRDESFQIFGKSNVTQSFRENLRNGFEGFVKQYEPVDMKMGDDPKLLK